MKKVTLYLSTAILSVVMAGSANAQRYVAPKTNYWGLDLVHNIPSFGSEENVGGGNILDPDLMYSDSITGFGAYIGTKLNKNYGVEVGFNYSVGQEKDIAAGATIGTGTTAPGAFSTELTHWTIYSDVVGYLPMTDHFELIGSAGLGYSVIDSALTIPGIGTVAQDEGEATFRLGAGAEFGMTQSSSIRAMVRYQTADFDGLMDNMMTYSIGAKFDF